MCNGIIKCETALVCQQLGLCIHLLYLLIYLRYYYLKMCTVELSSWPSHRERALGVLPRSWVPAGKAALRLGCRRSGLSDDGCLPAVHSLQRGAALHQGALAKGLLLPPLMYMFTEFQYCQTTIYTAVFVLEGVYGSRQHCWNSKHFSRILFFVHFCHRFHLKPKMIQKHTHTQVFGWM